MAIQIDITDDKGVKTRYHKIQKYTYDAEKTSKADPNVKTCDTMTITLRHYVNATLRDAQKNALAQNAKVDAYEKNEMDLQAQLMDLMTKNTDGSLDAQVESISDKLNALFIDTNRPKRVDATDKFYYEDEIEIPFSEPISQATIYDYLISNVPSYKGGVKI